MIDLSPVGGVPGAGWSTGQQLIDTVGLQPQATEHWKIVGYAINTKLVFASGGVQIPFGKLGKIKAGLAIPLPATSTISSVPGVPFVALPQDSTLVSDLYDPDTDPFPPTWTGAARVAGTPPTPLLNLATTVTLPQPLDLTQLAAPYSQITVGIWTLPSLWGSLIAQTFFPGLALFNSQFTVYYDDGH